MLENLLAFTGAAILISMAPGPSTVVIMRQSMLSGRRAGVAAILGNETGVVLWGLAAALGLSMVLAASQLAYDSMRILGAAVLICFGAKALWQARRGVHDTDEPMQEPASASGTLFRSWRLGVVTNLANPKAGVFAISFLPQFVPDGAPVFAMLVGYSVLWALIDTVWYLGIVWLIGTAKRFFARPSVRRRLEQVSGIVLVGLGIRLATDVSGR